MSVRLIRNVVLVAAMVAATATDGSAFDFAIHVQITNEGVGQVLSTLSKDAPNARKQLDTTPNGAITTFTATALKEIADANKAQDTDDCLGRYNFTIAASPCGDGNPVRGNSWYAYQHLADEPAWEHFDAEQFQPSSDFVAQSRARVLDFIRRGNYIGGRKALGQALHALQDFYAHSNYVELQALSYPRSLPPIDTRIGGSFAGGSPRPALEKAPTCRSGQYLTTKDLTSGFFFKNPYGVFEPDAIAVDQKCRHGWKNDSGTIVQPGISKDTADNPNFPPAHALAVTHSTQFILKLVEEVLSDTTLSLEDRVYCVLGLMGYENPEVIQSFRIGIPGAPNGASWDTALGGLLRGNLKNIQPDISVCFESRKVPRSCGLICPDADWSNDLNAYVCEGNPVPDMPGILVTPDLRMLVREADVATVAGQAVGYVANRVIANFRVDDPRACDRAAGAFCTVQLDPDRAVWIQFTFARVPKYTGPQRSDGYLPAATTVPVAKPTGTGSMSPTAPPSAPASNPAVTFASASPTSTPPPTPTAFARPPAAASASLRTADGIDQRLALRDLNNCSGADMFYPQMSGQTTQARQAYQMAAFSLAISDPATKQTVLNAIQARVGDDAFFSAMTDVIANPLQSQALVTAYQNTAKNISQQISSSGLTSLMPSPVPPSALPSFVDRWVASKLSTPALVSSAVNMMATSSLTAECTVNELAKQGFTDMVLAR